MSFFPGIPPCSMCFVSCSNWRGPFLLKVSLKIFGQYLLFSLPGEHWQCWGPQCPAATGWRVVRAPLEGPGSQDYCYQSRWDNMSQQFVLKKKRRSEIPTIQTSVLSNVISLTVWFDGLNYWQTGSLHPILNIPSRNVGNSKLWMNSTTR